MSLPTCYRCHEPMTPQGMCGCKDGICLVCGDCREVLPLLETGSIDLVLTDPPYGQNHKSNRPGAPRKNEAIQGDCNTELRDWFLSEWHGPWVCFGTCKTKAPVGYRGVLVWDKGGHVGMGDLSFPWKQNWEHIYIAGDGFKGRRGTGVLRFNAIEPWGNKLQHPHEKPVPLLRELLQKSPPGLVFDPFTGSGTTLRAAKDLGRRALGIEIEEKYCRIAAERLKQNVLFT